MLVREGRADGMLCGTFGPYASHLKYVAEAIGLRAGVNDFAAMHLLMLPQQTVFICDTYINPEPTAEQLADIALLAAEEVRRFGLEPRMALLSHSSFGSADTPSARKMREALALIRTRAPELEVEGEMHADAALSKRVLDQAMPEFAPDGRGQPADHAQPGRRQHHLQRAQDRGRRRASPSARSCSAPPSRCTSLPPPAPCAAWST